MNKNFEKNVYHVFRMLYCMFHYFHIPVNILTKVLFSGLIITPNTYTLYERNSRSKVKKSLNPIYGKLVQETRYPCSKCNRSYKNKRHLYRHVQVECGKEPQFQCPHCSYRGRYRDHLNKHMAALHSESFNKKY